MLIFPVPQPFVLCATVVRAASTEQLPSWGWLRATHTHRTKRAALRALPCGLRAAASACIPSYGVFCTPSLPLLLALSALNSLISLSSAVSTMSIGRFLWLHAA